jgi:hypothetical protein
MFCIVGLITRFQRVLHFLQSEGTKLGFGGSAKSYPHRIWFSRISVSSFYLSLFALCLSLFFFFFFFFFYSFPLKI